MTSQACEVIVAVVGELTIWAFWGSSVKRDLISPSLPVSLLFFRFFSAVTSLLGEVIVRRLLLKCGNGLEVLDWGVGRLIGNSRRVPLSYRPIKENSWKGRIARK